MAKANVRSAAPHEDVVRRNRRPAAERLADRLFSVMQTATSAARKDQRYRAVARLIAEAINALPQE